MGCQSGGGDGRVVVVEDDGGASVDGGCGRVAADVEGPLTSSGGAAAVVDGSATLDDGAGASVAGGPVDDAVGAAVDAVTAVTAAVGAVAGAGATDALWAGRGDEHAAPTSATSAMRTRPRLRPMVVGYPEPSGGFVDNRGR